MLQSALGFEGAFSAPHRSAALAGRDILKAGGTAMEAMVAAAATIAVTYPHMNSIGGDGFWLVHRPGEKVTGISACGQAAGLATPEWYAQRGHTTALPTRGGAAALTVPGTLGGWEKALELVPQDARLPLGRLLQAAIFYADEGIAVTGNQSVCIAEKLDSLRAVPGFAETFLIDGAVPKPGARLCQKPLAETLRRIADEGFSAWYRGDLAKQHSAFLEEHGSPLRYQDFARYEAEIVEPLHVETSHGLLMNMVAPTQGVASLMILALFDRLGVTDGESFSHLHGLVEATKQAFILRNAGLGDPAYMSEPAQDWLADDRLDALAARIDMEKALPWPYQPGEGDTIWMGAADRYGNVVSFIQSVYWEFGSGLTCPETGVVFQNRGAGFVLKPGPNQLSPGKRPFHTLNPALAQLKDGRVMAYGTMGGEGQPQTQAALFSRYVRFGQGLQQAVTAPRWLLGRTWGEETTTLKLEDRFDPALVAALRQAGHAVEMLPAFSDTVGHAGAVVLHADGLMEAASDPRADGFAITD